MKKSRVNKILFLLILTIFFFVGCKQEREMPHYSSGNDASTDFENNNSSDDEISDDSECNSETNSGDSEIPNKYEEVFIVRNTEKNNCIGFFYKDSSTCWFPTIPSDYEIPTSLSFCSEYCGNYSKKVHFVYFLKNKTKNCYDALLFNSTQAFPTVIELPEIDVGSDAWFFCHHNYITCFPLGLSGKTYLYEFTDDKIKYITSIDGIWSFGVFDNTYMENNTYIYGSEINDQSKICKVDWSSGTTKTEIKTVTCNVPVSSISLSYGSDYGYEDRNKWVISCCADYGDYEVTLYDDFSNYSWSDSIHIVFPESFYGDSLRQVHYYKGKELYLNLKYTDEHGYTKQFYIKNGTNYEKKTFFDDDNVWVNGVISFQTKEEGFYIDSDFYKYVEWNGFNESDRHVFDCKIPKRSANAHPGRISCDKSSLNDIHYCFSEFDYDEGSGYYSYYNWYYDKSTNTLTELPYRDGPIAIYMMLE